MKKMKKISAVMVALIIALCLMVFSAAAGSDDFEYESYGEGTIEIISCWLDDGGEIKIPEEIDGKTVVSICDYTFEFNSMSAVTIPVTVERIGDYAFDGCDGLSNVYYNGSAAQWNAISIGGGNDALLNAAIHFAETVCSHENVIEYEAKEPTCTEDGFTAGTYCSDCETWVEGHTVVAKLPHTDSDENYFCDTCEEYLGVLIETGSCGENVIYKLYEDGMLVISGNGITMDWNDTLSPFAGYDNLKTVIISEGITHIGDNMFRGCKNIESVIISNSVIHLGAGVFENCTSLTSITIPDSVVDIERYAFYGCTSLGNITIPDSVTSIGNSVFYNCTSLESIIIPDSVTLIGGYAFYRCTSLESIIIPDSVTSIGYSAFLFCTSLESITLPFIGQSATDYRYLGYIFGAHTYSYNNSCVPSSLKEVIISDKCIGVDSNAFYNCTSLTKITIPDSVISIGSDAFYGCTSLESITLPFIGGSATDNRYLGYIFGATDYYGNKSCVPSSLKEVIISDKCPSISSNAFYNCTSLTKITIPDSVTSIEDGTFYCCSSLEEITIPDGVTGIGIGAFYGCTSLECLTIPDSVTSIGAGAFSGCISIVRIMLPKKLSRVEAYLFEYCYNLKSIDIPDSVTSIEEGAFNCCSSLEEITIPSNVDIIPHYTFGDCLALKRVFIHENLKSICDFAFDRCHKLESIFYEGSEEQWENISIGNFNYFVNVYYNHFALHSMSNWTSADNGTHVKYCQNEYSCPYTETSDCTYSEWNITKSATCGEIGSKSKTCTVCGYVVTEAITKLPHTPDTAVTENRVEPKCEIKGSYDEVVYCSVCDTELSRTEKEIPAFEHNWDNGVVNPISTCKTHGTKTYTCQNDASHKKTEQVALDATNHEGGTYLKDKADATCTSNGYTGDTYCSGCNVKLSSGEVINSPGHDMSGWSKNSNGTHSRYCSRDNCKYTETENCAYTAWTTTKDSTCSEAGSKSKSCTVCGYTDTETIEKLPHTPASAVTENRVEPKCEVKGSYDEVVYCSVCDTELSREGKEIPALDHNWDNGVINPVSTCKTHGTKTYTCQNDASHKKTEKVDLNSSNHEGGTYIKNVRESTCTTEGYTGDIYCVGCDTKLETGKPIDKLAHTLADKIIENKVDATCEDTGSYDEVVYCSVCDAELSRETEVVDAFGHNEINHKAKAPTCTEIGWNTYETCSRCDYTTYEELAATGHGYKSVVTAPACDSIGYTTHTCSACGEVYTDTFVNANGHKGGTATCTQKARCSVCGEAYGSLKAHTYKTVTIKATLTKNGKIESKCSCGKVKSTQTIAKISSVTLSATKYIHDGKNKTPTVTVKDANGKKLIKNTDYKLSVASSRKGIGKYTVKVTFIGKYSGTKNVYFTILPGKPASVKSAAQTTSSVKLTWSKVSGAAGYTVYRYSPSKKAYVKAGTTEGTSLTVKGLLTGTKYTFKVVAYGKTSGGKVYNSEGYTLLKTATKTKTPAISKITTTKGKAVLTHTNVSGETGYTVYYSTKKDSGFKKYNNFKADTTTCNITKLTSGKTYYFKVRTYIKTDSGYVYSPWSAVKGIKVK